MSWTSQIGIERNFSWKSQFVNTGLNYCLLLKTLTLETPFFENIWKMYQRVDALGCYQRYFHPMGFENLQFLRSTVRLNRKCNNLRVKSFRTWWNLMKLRLVRNLQSKRISNIQLIEITRIFVEITRVRFDWMIVEITRILTKMRISRSITRVRASKINRRVVVIRMCSLMSKRRQ